MSVRDYFELGLYIALIFLMTKPLGLYMEKVFDGSPHFLRKVFGRLEMLIYKLGE